MVGLIEKSDSYSYVFFIKTDGTLSNLQRINQVMTRTKFQHKSLLMGSSSATSEYLTFVVARI
jgi:hypothetical protein